jgi:hypothetical protein
VFAHKNKDDGTPDWQIVSIPTGSYEIEQIDAEFQRRIKSITGKDSKIAIKVHQPTLSSTIEISTEGYFVDIYRSSIRTVLGWPEISKLEKTTPEPKKSDYITDKIAAVNSIRTYNYLEEINFSNIYERGDRLLFVFPRSTNVNPKNKFSYKMETLIGEFSIDSNFEDMNKDLSLLLLSLKSGSLTQAEFIDIVTICNKIIHDMEIFNLSFIGLITDKNSPASNTDYAKDYNIKIKENPEYKLTGYNAPELKIKLSDAIDEGFKKIHDAWTRKQRQETTLTHNNDPDGGGRHIAPHNVNISSVIALNLTCDAIEGSYQINLEQSDQSQQGYILYSFAPSVSPGFLIIEDPTNPFYMRCHNKFLTRINFKLTDQSNNLIDLRGEVLAISLFVKS